MIPCTLLLTPQMAPHRVVSWQKAVVLLFLGKIEILEEYDVPIRTPRFDLLTPAVARLVRSGGYGYLRRPVSFSRANVLLRDGLRCQYCGAERPAADLNQDHVVPRARGGLATWENIVASCYRCNQKKGNRTPEEAGMKLLRKPFRPRWLAQAPALREGASVPGEWARYLGGWRDSA